MTLKCQCCGFEREFEGGEEAYEAGWDAPPHITGYVCCDLCPGVCIVLGMSHKKAHAKWARTGKRPETWTPGDCGVDEDIVEALLQ